MPTTRTPHHHPTSGIAPANKSRQGTRVWHRDMPVGLLSNQAPLCSGCLRDCGRPTGKGGWNGNARRKNSARAGTWASTATSSRRGRSKRTLVLLVIPAVSANRSKAPSRCGPRSSSRNAATSRSPNARRPLKP